MPRSFSPELVHWSTAVFPSALMTAARPRPSLKSGLKHCVYFQGAAATGWGVICWWVIYSSSLRGRGRLSKMLVHCPLIKTHVSEQAFPFPPRMCLLWPLPSQTGENDPSNYQLDWYSWLSRLCFKCPVVASGPTTLSSSSNEVVPGRALCLTAITSITWNPIPLISKT